MTTTSIHDATGALVRRHLRIGWWTLAVFATTGLVLEGLHGFKVRWYLDLANETRRLMWTLGHAHGTALGLVHVAFAATVALRGFATRATRIASACLIGATVALPGGFFLGGAVTYDGDPGVGVVLVPLGAVLLVVALVLLAVGDRAPGASSRGGRPTVLRRVRNGPPARESSR